jgi:hypothetical protein
MRLVSCVKAGLQGNGYSVRATYNHIEDEANNPIGQKFPEAGDTGCEMAECNDRQLGHSSRTDARPNLIGNQFSAHEPLPGPAMLVLSHLCSDGNRRHIQLASMRRVAEDSSVVQTCLLFATNPAQKAGARRQGSLVAGDGDLGHHAHSLTHRAG